MKRFNILENRRRNLRRAGRDNEAMATLWFLNRTDFLGGFWLLNSRINLQSRRPGHPVLSQLP